MSRETVADQQANAWGYYGWPGSSCKAVGEVRYVVGWIADQLGRLDWLVKIDGATDWTVTVPAGDGTSRVIRSTESDDPDTDHKTASKDLLDLINWPTSVAPVATNLFVAGAGDFVQTPDGWRVVSVVDPNRRTLTAGLGVKFLWPHPADSTKPDAPLFSVLPLLDSLDWMQRQSNTQSRQRVLTSGVAVVADSFEGPNGEGFWALWEASIRSRMTNTEDLSPIMLRGAAELVKDGINWIVPPLGYDEVLDRRITSAIHRLAYGLPVPPEILLGMQAQSRATAFQVEENAYRAHIEPPAGMLATVAADALALLLGVDVSVEPDPTELLARRQSVQDVKDAYDRGEVSGDYLREVLGIPPEAAPHTGDTTGNGGSAPAATDPANQAADEPVTAAAAPDELTTLLGQVDSALAHEIAGATVMAVERARQRLGAAARSNETVRGNKDYRGLKSAELAATLGAEGLAAARVDIPAVIAEPVDAAAKWWLRRLTEAWGMVEKIVPGWAAQGTWATESVALFADTLSTHIVASLSEPDAEPLAGADINRIVDAAAGG